MRIYIGTGECTLSASFYRFTLHLGHEAWRSTFKNQVDLADCYSSFCIFFCTFFLYYCVCFFMYFIVHAAFVRIKLMMIAVDTLLVGYLPTLLTVVNMAPSTPNSWLSETLEQLKLKTTYWSFYLYQQVTATTKLLLISIQLISKTPDTGSSDSWEWPRPLVLKGQ